MNPSTPRPEATDLGRTIAAALPPDQASAAMALADILAALREGRLSPEEAASQLAAERRLGAALQALAGQQVAYKQATITFGAGSQVGDVTIGDVASGDIIKLTVNLASDDLGRRRFLLIAGGLALLVALSVAGLLRLSAADRRGQAGVNAAVAADVLANLSNLDGQLGQIEVAMGALPEPTAAGSYRALLSAAMLAELRENLNTDRLSTDLGATYIQNLVASGADPAAARAFYEQLREVEDNTGELLDSLAELGAQRPDQPGWIAYYRDLADLNWRRLRVNGAIAHLDGLLVLHSLDYDPADAAARLSGLRHAEPRSLAPVPEIEAALGGLIEELGGLVAERAALVTRGKSLLAGDLEVQPTDSAELVVAKAISLRKFGNIDAAVAAFAQYGAMFSATDDTAAQYAATAQAFTRQSVDLGVEAGMYIFQIFPDSNGARAGLQVGDIVIALNETTIADADAFRAAAQALPADRPVAVTLLRQNGSAAFERLVFDVSAPPMGIGVMPI